MGRKGMKGFLKGVHKHHGSDDEMAEDPAAQPGTPAAKTAAAPTAPKPAQPAVTPSAEKPTEAGDSGSDEDDEGDSKGPETRGKMLQRHKREMAAHKKVAQKRGSKKKDEAAKLTAEMEARHARELSELEEREKQQQQSAAAVMSAAAAAGPEAEEGAAEQLAGLGLGGGHSAAENKKQSKAQKRREKLAQQDAEREARIASEQAALGPSDMAVEEQALQALLLPLRLGIREIRADGHCLYRSIEDQLAQELQQQGAAAGGGGAVPDYLALRRLAAAHIRSHAAEFLPFIWDEDAGGAPEEQLEAYCAELEGSASWGGQVELGALAQALRKQIKVYATGMPPVTLGDEHAGEGVLQLCYLRHAFGLGAHYNSVAPLGGAGAAAGAGQDG